MTSARTYLETTLQRNWLRRGPLAWALLPVAGLFRVLSTVRRILYARGMLSSVRLPVPVLIVGNVFVGGTGKTPFTIWLAQALRDAGYRPAVISRGYGAAAGQPQRVMPDSDPSVVGDEPLLIAQRAQCPVMVGRNRVATARALLALHPEVNLILSDDGLQHYALQRDIEIVLCDARGNGNGWVLPAGPLREPASRRRDFTVVNGGPLTAFDDKLLHAGSVFNMHLAGEVAEKLADRSHSIRLAELAARTDVKIVAAAGIGNPSRFFNLLHQAGLSFMAMPLPDHHDFADQPFAGLDADIILITEKDAVKCAQIETLRHDPRLWVVPVTAHIDHALLEQILEKCRGFTTA